MFAQLENHRSFCVCLCATGHCIAKSAPWETGKSEKTWRDLHVYRDQRTTIHGKHKDMCELGDKGSVASVTRYKRPRADSSHGLSLINALSSFPLSEPSLKELHTSRAPLGLSHRPTDSFDEVCILAWHVQLVLHIWILLKQRIESDLYQTKIATWKHDYRISTISISHHSKVNLAARG